MSELSKNITRPREPIYHETCLRRDSDPAQTLYNCQCMLSMLGMKELEGCEITGEAAVGVGLIFHQVQLALGDIAERYDFVERKSD